MRTCYRVVFTLASLAAVYLGLDLLARPSYPVPEKGSVVLVTGAKRGIGFSAAARLAKEGFFVLASVRSAADVEAIEDLRIENLHAIVLDVTSQADVERVANETKALCARRHVGFGGVVHNALSFGDMMFLELSQGEKFNEVVQSGLVGVASLTRALLPLLRESHGRIIGISSIATFLPMNYAYNAVKAGLSMMLACLRVEVFEHQIAVVNVVAGFVKTEALDETASSMVMERLDTSEMRTLYPHANGARLFKGTLVGLMSTFSPLPNAPGSTDDAILHALTSAHPPLSMYPGTMILPVWFVAMLNRILPESIWFILTR